MNRSLCSLAISVALALALASAARAGEPGYVDFGQLTAPKKGEFVQITLGKGLLKFASLISRCHDRSVAEVVSGLSHVRVNVVGLDDSNRDVTHDRVQRIRAQLAQRGWDQIVTAQGRGEEDVAVYLKQRGEDVIEGIVVTVIDGRKKEAVLVNIVGTLKAEQIGALGEHLQVEPLRRLKPQRSPI